MAGLLHQIKDVLTWKEMTASVTRTKEDAGKENLIISKTMARKIKGLKMDMLKKYNV